MVQEAVGDASAWHGGHTQASQACWCPPAPCQGGLHASFALDNLVKATVHAHTKVGGNKPAIEEKTENGGRRG